ncbi:ATP-binding cassette domain-containing protein [Actinopolymorpha pittospori]|uniref:ATP-binding cassette subfamily B protein n=1 Tax=Actinopolymorpha pittospori TaxID=648752 RepID=A0A927N0D4_9ACTN|nr:ATP-binding cassette subfamily B protein [Actinopolymorpha pittospori]
MRHYRLFMEALWRADRRRFMVVAVGVLATGLLPAVLMVASGRVIEAITGVVTGDQDSARRGLMAVAWFVVFSLLMAGARWMTATAQAGLSQRLLAWVEDRLATAVLGPATVAHLEDPAVMAEIDAASEASRENVYYWALRGFVQSSTVRLTGVVSAVVLLALSWWAPLLLVAGYAGLLVAYVRWEQVSADDLSETIATSRRRSEYYRELLAEPAAAKEVRIFGLAGWLDFRFGSVWLAAMEAVWRRRGRVQRLLTLGTLGLVAVHVVVVGGLAHAALAGTISVAAVAVFVQAIAGMDGLISAQYDSLGVAKAGTALARLRTLSTRLEQSSAAPVEDADPGPCAVELRDVTFHYPGSKRAILDHLDLRVEPGSSLAIVGVNGAGKSTLTKLLAGLYRPDSGAVLVDGKPADPAGGRVAAVFQSFGRYELSLRDNVTLGAPGIDDREVEKALGLAGAARLGATLDTPLAAAYDGGTDLSGGQWQRVALARALVAVERGAGLLILDEPTASLDVRAEIELFEQFLEVTRGVTTILVSHRLSSVRHADRIVLLDGAHVVEDGTHEELMTAGGGYATMFTLQASRFAVGVADAG